jgi:hypothetical protein
MPSVKYADAAVPMTSKPCLVVRTPRQCSHRAVNIPARRCLATMAVLQCSACAQATCHVITFASFCARTLYWMASSTDMSALRLRAVRTAPLYTSRGILRRICAYKHS